MRECRKCGEKIPYKIKIGNKWKSLQNRKFCLKCSSYKRHNTSPYDPIERQKKGQYSDWKQSQKEINVLCSYKRGLSRKDILIEKSGGKCIKCGYNKCKRALVFHHRDRTTKIFGLDLHNLWSQSLESIEQEFSKCDLLCANCHAEVEDEIAKNGSNLVSKVNAKYGTNF